MSNVMWHVALEPGATKMQDVIVASIDADDFQAINYLLSTNHLKGKVFESERGSFLVMYGGEYERPYPSVMIWRVEDSEEKSTISDMRQEDGWILKHVWRDWLMPEDAEEEYEPPKQFLVMARMSNAEFSENGGKQ